MTKEYSEQPTQRDGQTQKTLSELLDQMERSANAATPPPWCFDQRGDKCNDIQIGTAFDKFNKPMSGDISDHELNEVTYLEKISGEVQNPSDADFIAAARSDFPKLVKAMRHFQTYVEIITRSERHRESAELVLEEVAQLLREPADSVQDGNENQPVAQVSENQSPSSAVADDVKAAVARLRNELRITVDKDSRLALDIKLVCDAVSSPVGGVSSSQCLCEPETRVLACPIHGDPDHEAFDSPTPPPSVERVLQMERATGALEEKEEPSDSVISPPQTALVLEALKEARAAFNEILTIHWGWDGDCGASRLADDGFDVVDNALKAILSEHGGNEHAGGASSPNPVPSPVFSVERDTQQDLGIPGGV